MMKNADNARMKNLAVFSGTWKYFVVHWQKYGDGFIRWVAKCEDFMPWLKTVQPGKHALLDTLFGDDRDKWEHCYLIKSVLLIDEEASSVPGADLTMMFTFSMLVQDTLKNPDRSGEALIDFLETSGAYFLEEAGKQHEIHLLRQSMWHPKYNKSLLISDPDGCKWTFYWEPEASRS